MTRPGEQFGEKLCSVVSALKHLCWLACLISVSRFKGELIINGADAICLGTC